MTTRALWMLLALLLAGSPGGFAAAQAEADAQGISGKAVTPFLLGRIVELTGGRSLATNIALVRNNAKLAAGIASALAGTA